MFTAQVDQFLCTTPLAKIGPKRSSAVRSALVGGPWEMMSTSVWLLDLD
jgi:hypothetical protein